LGKKVMCITFPQKLESEYKFKEPTLIIRPILTWLTHPHK